MVHVGHPFTNGQFKGGTGRLVQEYAQGDPALLRRPDSTTLRTLISRPRFRIAG